MDENKVPPINILEEVVFLCSDRYACDMTPRAQFRKIKALARRNAKMLTEILEDYVRLNESDPTYRKARLKAAKPSYLCSLLGVDDHRR